MKESFLKNSASFSNRCTVMKATNTSVDSADEETSQKPKFYDCSYLLTRNVSLYDLGCWKLRELEQNSLKSEDEYKKSKEMPLHSWFNSFAYNENNSASCYQNHICTFYNTCDTDNKINKQHFSGHWIMKKLVHRNCNNCTLRVKHSRNVSHVPNESSKHALQHTLSSGKFVNENLWLHWAAGTGWA